MNQRLVNVTLDAKKLQKQLSGVAKSAAAGLFRDEINAHAKRVLTAAAKATPLRSRATITAKQKTQYNKRVNYIPSFAQNASPPATGFLRANKTSGEWFYFRGKWFFEKWRIPPAAEARRQQLRAERRKRMAKSQAQFIAERLESQGLFRRQWVDMGASIGLAIPASAAVKTARGRGAMSRKRPQPPKSYARIQGGKGKLTVTFFSKLLNESSGGGAKPLSTEKYKPFNAPSILRTATASSQTRFREAVTKKLRRELNKK